jgi:hypothetical protein
MKPAVNTCGSHVWSLITDKNGVFDLANVLNPGKPALIAQLYTGNRETGRTARARVFQASEQFLLPGKGVRTFSTYKYLWWQQRA